MDEAQAEIARIRTRLAELERQAAAHESMNRLIRRQPPPSPEDTVRDRIAAEARRHGLDPEHAVALLEHRGALPTDPAAIPAAVGELVAERPELAPSMNDVIRRTLRLAEPAAPAPADPALPTGSAEGGERGQPPPRVVDMNRVIRRALGRYVEPEPSDGYGWRPED